MIPVKSRAFSKIGKANKYFKFSEWNRCWSLSRWVHSNMHACTYISINLTAHEHFFSMFPSWFSIEIDWPLFHEKKKPYHRIFDCCANSFTCLAFKWRCNEYIESLSSLNAKIKEKNWRISRWNRGLTITYHKSQCIGCVKMVSVRCVYKKQFVYNVHFIDVRRQTHTQAHKHSRTLTQCYAMYCCLVNVNIICVIRRQAH